MHWQLFSACKHCLMCKFLHLKNIYLTEISPVSATAKWEIIFPLFFLFLQMGILPGPLHPMVTMQTGQRNSGGTTTSCRTSTTRRPPRRTSAPRAGAAETPCPPDLWSPPSRSVCHVFILGWPFNRIPRLSCRFKRMAFIKGWCWQNCPSPRSIRERLPSPPPLLFCFAWREKLLSVRAGAPQRFSWILRF